MGKQITYELWSKDKNENEDPNFRKMSSFNVGENLPDEKCISLLLSDECIGKTKGYYEIKKIVETVIFKGTR